jgi:hypothetical protein
MAPASMAASTAVEPQRRNGPTVLTRTVSLSSSLRSVAGCETSATANSKPPSSAAIFATAASLRAASTGRASRRTSASATSLPV